MELQWRCPFHAVTPIPPSDFIRIPMEALAPVCATLGARIFVSTNMRAALEGLFDSPAGFLVILVPGDETPQGDPIDDLQVVSASLSILVSHRLPPTAQPSQGLYESVAGLPPFIDLIAQIRDTVRAMAMPEGSTGVRWRYMGRRAVDFDGILSPAFRLDFEIDAALPPALADADAVELAPPQPFDDLEDDPPPETEP